MSKGRYDETFAVEDVNTVALPHFEGDISAYKIFSRCLSANWEPVVLFVMFFGGFFCIFFAPDLDPNCLHDNQPFGIFELKGRY